MAATASEKSETGVAKVAESSLSPQSEALIKGRCDVCGNKDGFNGHNLQKCRDCGVLVHDEACYGAIPIGGGRKNPNFRCHACDYVGRDVVVSKPGDDREVRSIRQKERPSECVLCPIRTGVHAMHPLYDSHGPDGRHRVLPADRRRNLPKRLAWVHSLCALYLTVSQSFLYGCFENGEYEDEDGDGEDDGDDECAEGAPSEERARTAATAAGSDGDDRGNNDSNGGTSRSVSAASSSPVRIRATHHFVIMDRTNAEGDPAWLEIAQKIRDFRRIVKCDICWNSNGRGGKNSLRIPAQCSVGSPDEHPSHKKLHGNSEFCGKGFHVGCARWGPSPSVRGGKAAHRRIFFHPGVRGAVGSRGSPCANGFCSKHATVVHDGRKKRKKQRKKKCSQQSYPPPSGRERVLKGSCCDKREKERELGDSSPDFDPGDDVKKQLKPGTGDGFGRLGLGIKRKGEAKRKHIVIASDTDDEDSLDDENHPQRMKGSSGDSSDDDEKPVATLATPGRGRGSPTEMESDGEARLETPEEPPRPLSSSSSVATVRMDSATAACEGSPREAPQGKDWFDNIVKSDISSLLRTAEGSSLEEVGDQLHRRKRRWRERIVMSSDGCGVTMTEGEFEEMWSRVMCTTQEVTTRHAAKGGASDSGAGGSAATVQVKQLPPPCRSDEGADGMTGGSGAAATIVKHVIATDVNLGRCSREEDGTPGVGTLNMEDRTGLQQQEEVSLSATLQVDAALSIGGTKATPPAESKERHNPELTGNNVEGDCSGGKPKDATGGKVEPKGWTPSYTEDGAFEFGEWDSTHEHLGGDSG